jgi:serine/threonine-protein kinase
MGVSRSGAAHGSQLGSASRASWLSSSTSSEDGFAPGTMLLGRYRVVGLLGKGGMGEVYRADDLTLGQAVALKFLPRELATHPDRLARFHNEVRIARQVSHPNVCRVYDIGDLGGQPFLSMELVDGEDLASLLRRIGRLPKDKAIETGRQVCAGLAAAHNTGILHRDLKPANIMLDSHGKVRLTDFGLAVLQEQVGESTGRAGTPAYMSPEQLEGRELTIQSDIYSLGLVLYEMLTGKRPYKAESLAELSEQRSHAPAGPASLVEEIDPALERAILRCLESDPAMRPNSAIAVAASLPGGDPLAAALEAGETPSPDMVAAAGEEGRLRAPVAWGVLALVAAMLALLLVASPRYFLVNHVPLSKRPAVLEDRAMEIVRALGYATRLADRSSGFTYNGSFIEHVTKTDSSITRWETLREHEPSAILFWYRQSPEHMQPRERFSVSFENPPHLVPGMVRLLLDPAGRLVHFEAIPPEIEETQDSERDTTSAAHLTELQLFELAGLDRERFDAVESTWIPRTYCDTRKAWEGAYPSRPSSPLLLEAGFRAGQLVTMSTVGEWTQPWRPRSEQQSSLERAAGLVSTLLILALLISGVILARNNLQQGRGDRRGASRLAAFIVALYVIRWIFTANHAATLSIEFDQFTTSLALMMFVGSVFWVVYLALEPFMRRRWPDTIISWTRLLSGKFRDPLVGRDILFGVLFAMLLTFLDVLEHLLPEWLGIAPRVPERSSLLALGGVPDAFLSSINILAGTMFGPLAVAFLFLGLWHLTRSKWIAAGIIVLALGFIIGSQGSGGAHAQISIPLGFLLVSLWMFILLRFGVLSLVIVAFVSSVLDTSPITTDSSAWYAPSGAVAIVITVAVTLYGFFLAVGGKSHRGMQT